MSTAVIKELVAAIDSVKQNTKFCTVGDVDVDLKKFGSAFAIDGLRDLPLSMRPKDVREIIAFADTAPYGKGTKTLIDQSVRNSLEIKASKLTFAKPWDAAVQAIVQQAATELGLPADRVQAKPYKLLIYQRGGFFLPHRDSEKRRGMVGSLIVMLPSRFGGGELIVRHDSDTVRCAFEQAAAGERSQYAAFYADCLHEVRNVTRGVRVCLSYNLCLKATRRQSNQQHPQAALVSAIQNWIQSQPAKPMVFALEHQYTANGLKPSLLKGKDRTAAKQLIAAAKQADCHVHLGQVSRHLLEHADDGSYGRHSWERWSNVELSDLEIGEAYEDEVLVDGWKDADGKRVTMDAMNLESSSLISKTPLEEWKPTSFDYEGYTGNAGNTLDRWYHKSAVVIWSQADHYDVLIKMGLRGSINEFMNLCESLLDLDKDGREQADSNCRSFARAIIKVWPERLYRYHESSKEDAPWLADFASAIPTLNDSRITEDFLQRVALRDWQLKLGKVILGICKRLGPDEAFPILKKFVATTPQPNQYGVTRASGLPLRDAEWLFKVASNRKQGGLLPDQVTQLSQSMLSRLSDEVEKVNQGHGRFTPSGHFAPALKLLMKAAIARCDDDALEACLQLRREASSQFDVRAFDVKACTELVKWSDKKFAERLPALSHWLKETRAFLESETRTQPTKPLDFARPDTTSCNCQQCTELKSFLADPESESGEIRARKAQLEHVQQKIRFDELDATTKLDRTRRPFALRLTKTLGSHDRSVKRFESDLQLLASLPTGQE